MKSNEILLTIRQNLVKAFKQCESVAIPLLRFALSFAALEVLADVTHYSGKLSSIYITIILSAIGAFASAESILLVAIVISTMMLATVQPAAAIILFIGLCMIYILFGRLYPKESILIMAMLVALSMKVELLLVIATALFGSYMCIGALLIGIMLWYTIPSIISLLGVIEFSPDTLLETVNQLMEINYAKVLLNSQMLMLMVIFFIVFTSIYIIRKQSIDYAPYIAVAVGAAMTVLGFGLAIIFFGSGAIDIWRVSLEAVGFSLLAVVLQFLSTVIDYQRAEVVHFEDEDHYYFVKIVPKVQLTHKTAIVKKRYTDTPVSDEVAVQFMEDHSINQGL